VEQQHKGRKDELCVQVIEEQQKLVRVAEQQNHEMTKEEELRKLKKDREGKRVEHVMKNTKGNEKENNATCEEIVGFSAF
jgi:hypothetical protein